MSHVFGRYGKGGAHALVVRLSLRGSVGTSVAMTGRVCYSTRLSRAGRSRAGEAFRAQGVAGGKL